MGIFNLNSKGSYFKVSLEAEEDLDQEEDIENTSSSEEEEDSFKSQEEVAEEKKEEEGSALGVAASRSNLEKELVYYVRINDFSQLANANKSEMHEQWEIKIDKTDLNVSDGKMRVRKVTSSEGETIYYVTVKNKTDNGNFESTSRVSKAFFTQFKALSDYGMNKHRYTFNIKGTELKWEIDVYPDGKGGYYSWARAELEYQNVKLEESPKLPLDVEEVITPADQQSEEGKAKVYSLFNEIFLQPNEMAQELGEVPEEEPPSNEEVEEDVEEAGENAPPEPEEDEDSDGEEGSEEGDDESEDDTEEDDSSEDEESSDEDSEAPDVPDDLDESEILGVDEESDE